MLIECPACHTKFAIETSLLKKKKVAQFHCSRCQHYFEATPEEQPLRENPNAKVKTKKKAPEEKASYFGDKKVVQTSLILKEKLDFSTKQKLLFLSSAPFIFCIFFAFSSNHIDNLPSMLQKALHLDSSDLSLIHI